MSFFIFGKQLTEWKKPFQKLNRLKIKMQKLSLFINDSEMAKIFLHLIAYHAFSPVNIANCFSSIYQPCGNILKES